MSVSNDRIIVWPTILAACWFALVVFEFNLFIILACWLMLALIVPQLCVLLGGSWRRFPSTLILPLSFATYMYFIGLPKLAWM